MKRLLLGISVFVLCFIVNLVNYKIEVNNHAKSQNNALVKSKQHIQVFKEISLPLVSYHK